MNFKTAISVIPLLVLLSCTSRIKEKQIANFTTKTSTLSTDTTITAIAKLGKYLLCFQANRKFLVLNYDLIRQDSIEQKLDNYNLKFVIKMESEVYAGSKNGLFSIDTFFNLHKVDTPKIYKHPFFYEDDEFYVYPGCAGEFGGSIFFRDKQNGKTYSYFATCPLQVLKQDATYIICNSMDHMYGSSSFLKVKDPTQLFLLEDEAQETSDNWYMNVDSLKDIRNWPSISGVSHYGYAVGVLTLVSYQYLDNLYSIQYTDSSMYIAIHKNDSIVPIQTICKNRISMGFPQIIQFGDKTLAFHNSEGSYFSKKSPDKPVLKITVIEDNSIEFIEMNPKNDTIK